MSIVTVQLGQCGNQVGCELFHTFAAEATDSYCLQAAASGSQFRQSAAGESALSDAFSQSVFRSFFRPPEPAGATKVVADPLFCCCPLYVLLIAPTVVGRNRAYLRAPAIWQSPARCWSIWNRRPSIKRSGQCCVACLLFSN